MLYFVYGASFALSVWWVTYGVRAVKAVFRAAALGNE